MYCRPIISLIGASIRPALWNDYYESLRSNNIPFEIIFVGDRYPECALPDNFHFIFSRVKPAQCAEIASRYARGTFLLPTCDDIRYSEHALDIMHQTFLDCRDDRTIVSCRFSRDGDLWPIATHYFFHGDVRSPIMALGGFIKKEMWEKIGGIDSRFVASLWDLDIAMRIYELGGTVVTCEHVQANELRNKDEGIQLFADVGMHVDKALLEALWVMPPETPAEEHDIHCVNKSRGALSRRRLSPVVSFSDLRITTISQGPQGKWH